VKKIIRTLDFCIDSMHYCHQFIATRFEKIVAHDSETVSLISMRMIFRSEQYRYSLACPARERA
jgi:hypothetical protein